MPKDATASVSVGDVNRLAEEYLGALTTSDFPRAEAVATMLWEQYLFTHALRQASQHWKEFDQHVEPGEFARLGRERFIAEMTSERRESRTLADVHAHIEDSLDRATENVVLSLLAKHCQQAAANQNESEYQQCFWTFCAVAWPHVTHKVKQHRQYAWLESEILDEVERRLRAKLRQAEPIQHIFGFLDVVIARATSSVIRHALARAPTETLGNGPSPAPPAQLCLLESQQLWNHIEQWVTEIDRAAGEGKKLSLIYHLDLAGRTQTEIAQTLIPPISQAEVSKRLSYLCRELVQRLLSFLGQSAQPSARLTPGWQHRMIEVLREMKNNLADME